MKTVPMTSKHGSIAVLVAVMLPLALSVVACDDLATDPELGLALTVDRDRYGLGGSAQLELRNGYRHTVEPHWCGLLAQRLEGEDEWSDELGVFTGGCIGPVDRVRPGRSHVLDFVVGSPAFQTPGLYRIRITVQDPAPAGGAFVRVTSEPFAVLGSDDS